MLPALAMTMAPPILQLPLETLQLALCFADPFDLSAISQACRALREASYGPEGTFVWRSLFLRIWDDPRLRIYLSTRGGWHSGTQAELETAINAIEFDWKTELQKRLRAYKMLHGNPRASCKERKEVIKTFLSVIYTSAPAFISPDFGVESKNATWLRDTIESAKSLNKQAWPRFRHPELYSSEELPDLEECELRSEMHTYFSLTTDDMNPPTPVSEPTAPSKDGAEDSSEDEHELTDGSLNETDNLQPSVDPLPPSSSAGTGVTGIPHVPHTGSGRRYHTRATSDFFVRLLGLPDISPNTLSYAGLRTASRAFVYNRDNYIPSNKYAPLLNDLQGGFKPYWRHLEDLT
ncbi:hypothetical protein FRB90_009723, partial [Tulasnella sp. 427]